MLEGQRYLSSFTVLMLANLRCCRTRGGPGMGGSLGPVGRSAPGILRDEHGLDHPAESPH